MTHTAEYPPRRRLTRAHDESGIALLVVLAVVALLTIIVTEFTYTVTLDQHRTRNAVNALQAALLARSGINIAEGFLVQDAEPAFDAYQEDWWQALNKFCAGVALDPTMRIKCRVEDESGKINVNNTRVTRPAAAAAGVTPAPTPKAQLTDADLTPDAFLRDALRQIFQNHQLDVQIVDLLKEYWMQDPPPSKVPLGRPGYQAPIVPEFNSLEDFAATFHIPTEKLGLLRRLVTARPSRELRGINVNTAPAEVLAAIINDEGAVSQIVERQQSEGEPFRNAGEVTPLLGNVEHAAVIGRLFTTQSRFFRLQASALTNVDPSGQGGGGVGQTLSVLVFRQQDPRSRRGATQGLGWTLKPLDWQKEGGARLLQRPQEDLDQTDAIDQLSELDAGGQRR